MTGLKTMGSMYVTLLGPIAAGIVNSVWCRTKLMKRLQIPMDGGKKFFDGKRILGEGKTWKGFLGYIVLNIIFMILWGFVCDVTGMEAYNMFYEETANTVGNNFVIGLLLGLAYGIFELPNSFLKRRLDIDQSKNIKGLKKALFVFMDQADSVFGCVLVVSIYKSMTVGFYFVYVTVGAVTHIVINMLLYFMKLRKNMF